MSAHMDHALFVETVDELYGPHGVAAAARDLGVNERTVRRWYAGRPENPIPAEVAGRLAAVCRRRRDRLGDLARQLQEAADA